MRLLLALVCLCGALAAAQAAELRVPKEGAHFFRVTLLKGWHGKFDRSGGMLLIPPPASQHAMIYLGMLSDGKYRALADAAAMAQIAQRDARLAGIDTLEKIDSEKPAQISGRNGTAFSGSIRSRRPRYARKATIVLVRLAPDTFAQEWVVTQPGMGYVERDALDKALANIAIGQ